MPCCVCCVGPHRDYFAHASEDNKNTRRVQRLRLNHLWTKTCLRKIVKVICRCQIAHGLICIFCTYTMIHTYYNLTSLSSDARFQRKHYLYLPYPVDFKEVDTRNVVGNVGSAAMLPFYEYIHWFIMTWPCACFATTGGMSFVNLPFWLKTSPTNPTQSNSRDP